MVVAVAGFFASLLMMYVVITVGSLLGFLTCQWLDREKFGVPSEMLSFVLLWPIHLIGAFYERIFGKDV